MIKVVEDWYGPLQWIKTSPIEVLKSGLDEDSDDSGEDSDGFSGVDNYSDADGGSESGAEGEEALDDASVSEESIEKVNTSYVGLLKKAAEDQVIDTCRTSKEKVMMKKGGCQGVMDEVEGKESNPSVSEGNLVSLAEWVVAGENTSENNILLKSTVLPIPNGPTDKPDCDPDPLILSPLLKTLEPTKKPVAQFNSSPA